MRENNESIKNSLTAILNAGDIKDVRYVQGYATSVFLEDEDGYGTIEFVSFDGDTIIEDVKISAIEQNTKGSIKLPAIDSDVTIALINDTDAYLVAYSHINVWNITVDSECSIKAVGVEDVDSSTDYDEVEETGETGEVTISVDSVVIKSANDDAVNLTTITPANHLQEISEGSDTSSIDMSPTETTLTSSTININSDQTSVGVGATEKAVLGDKLQTAIEAFIDSAASITGSGVVNPVTAAATALKAQLAAALSQVTKIK